MKKTILTIIVLPILLSTTAFAGSCNIPSFIKKGAIISFYAGGIMEEKNVKIVEIDTNSCWIKTDQKRYSWVNLNTIVAITPPGK